MKWPGNFRGNKTYQSECFIMFKSGVLVNGGNYLKHFAIDSFLNFGYGDVAVYILSAS